MDKIKIEPPGVSISVMMAYGRIWQELAFNL
jgi:hypothetical protein